MNSTASSSNRNGMGVALIVAGCVLADAMAWTVLDWRSRSLLPWLPAVAVACLLAVLFRQAWLASIPIALALLLALTAQAASGVHLAKLSLVTSLVFLARSRAFRASPGIPAPFLAACSGWSCAAGLFALLAALRRPSAWHAPVLLFGLSLGLGVWSRARRHDVGTDARPGREYLCGFATYVAVFLLLVVAAILAKLPMAGANSGSAAPDAWPANQR